jgi:hypothetical protein
MTDSVSPLQAAAESPAVPSREGPTVWTAALIGLIALVCWLVLYLNLGRIARWLIYSLLRLPSGTHFSSAVEFLVFEVPKVLLLLTAVVFVVGIVRSFFTPERTRRILAGTRESVGTVLAALLGVVTPFCSCSAVPLFLGFVTAGVPLGVTFSFLISAPMVNEVALVLLFGLFGWKVAAIYMTTGLVIAMVSGWVIGRLGMEDQLEPWVRKVRSGDTEGLVVDLGWRDRIRFGLEALRDIVGKVWLYVVAGIAVGAAIHGWVPTNFMASFMGKDVWWAVPVVVLIGIPMYSNAAGIIPIVQALLEKGAALGTVLAFMMSVISISTPEVIILRKVLRPRLIAVFVGVVTVGILIVGFLFNAIL